MRTINSGIAYFVLASVLPFVFGTAAFFDSKEDVSVFIGMMAFVYGVEGLLLLGIRVCVWFGIIEIKNG